MSFADRNIAVKLIGNALPPCNKFSLWYRQPATTDTTLSKSNDALPIGNGRLGAMVQGGIEFERLQLNEESLWSGGPGGEESQYKRGNQGKYNFGFNSQNPDIDEIYQKLKQGASEYSMTTQGVCETWIQGNDGGYGNYKNFGYLELNYMHKSGTLSADEIEVKNYRRELDLEDGVCRVRYDIGETTYTREYLASYPDNAIAVHISANSENADTDKINLVVSVTSGQSNGKIDNVLQVPKVSAQDGTITLTGGLHDNGLLYVGVFKVDAVDGTITTSEKTVTVTDANSVTVYFTATTDYKNEYTLPDGSELFELLTYRTGESMDELESRVLDNVSTLTHEGYSEFANRHRADYSALFRRVKFDLGGENNMPTDIALADYGTDCNADCDTSSMRMLEALLYQYGRYLLISSSRKGSLPANLQGVWNSDNFPPWASDYHTNINLQMNYWAAGGGNMVELIEPLAEYLKSLMVTGRYTAQKYCYALNTLDNTDAPADAWKHDGAGWTTHTSSNIFGFTATGFAWYWGWAPTAGAWISQNLYQYLQYGGDNNIFIRDYWPIIREAAIMWTKALYMPTDGFWAGKYVVVPSFSPEHGPLTVATASEQQLVWEIFKIALDCMEQLDIDDSALRADIEDKLAKLYNPVNISPVTGRIMEWTESEDEFNSNGMSADTAQGHRHLNHLVGFYPGTSIANGDLSNLEAVKKTLEWKGDVATGWSMGWKINLWARVGDGNRAYKLIQNLFDINLAKNMFGLHVLQDYAEDGYYFQIDANFGYTAGVQEMLLQSHLGILDLLPALPTVWESGSIEGIRTIGGHTVAMEWTSGELTSATITAFADGDIRVRNEKFLRDGIDIKLNGMSVSATNGIISFVAKENERYIIVTSTAHHELTCDQ